MAEPEKPEEVPTQVTESAELADIDPLDIPDDGHSFEAPAPRLKEYFTSPDAPSQYFIILSGIFALLALCCFVLLAIHSWRHRHVVQNSTSAASPPVEASFHVPLGEFKIQWDDAEMRADLNAECTTETACDELKAEYSEVHDLILPMLQGSSRSEILNPNQKLHLRQAIADKLNELQLKGHIVEVDFTDLTVEPTHK